MMRPMIRMCLVVLILAGWMAPLHSQKSPDEFLGVTVGGDRVLVPYPRIVEYLRYLDSQSNRVSVSDEGKSTLGNEMILAVISSEENIRRLPQLLEANRKLANPDRISPEEGRRLEEQGKVFVLITASIHASEIGASQMALLLAHELATAQDPHTKAILNEVVLLLAPSINPDGQIMVCDWYRKYLGTAYEGGSMPFLYHHYAGHDNNRDYFMLNLVESRVLNQVLHHRYFPHIYLDMHQMGTEGPRIFVPPFKDPLNQNLSPLMLRQVELLGASMALGLQEAGKKGVADSYGFDAYWPGGTKNTAWYKNVVGLLTELASVRVATPVEVDSSELSGGGKGLPEYKPQVNFPDPWPGGKWRLHDIVEYERIAALALLEAAAQNRQKFLSNFRAMGLENTARGEHGAITAYIIPPEQWDEPEARSFLRKMQEHGVRLSRLTADWTFRGRIYSQGSCLIAIGQPYGRFVQVMMERQRYPEILFSPGGPIMEPYDSTGWTLPLLMNVKHEAIAAPLSGMPLEPMAEVAEPEFAIRGKGDFYRLPGRFNRSFQVVNRMQKKSARVYRALEKPFTGDFLLPADSVSEDFLRDVCAGTGVIPDRIAYPAAGGLRQLRAPRIAIYQSNFPNGDEGWTRWILDQFEFPYRVLHNADFADRQFATQYDAVIFPSQSRSVIIEGKSNPDQPERFVPSEYRGGIGKEGVEALKGLVSRGGRLILNDQAWEIAQKDFELPVANALAGKTPACKCPGSILQIELATEDPLAWGLEPVSILYSSNSVVFRAGAPDDQRIQRRVVGRFAAEGPHLLSGYLEGGKALDRAVAIVRYQFESGQVVLLGGRVQFRAQSTATFKLLFNALFLP